MAAKPQFSLRVPFIAMAVVGVLMAEAFVFPPPIALAAGTTASVVFPAGLIAGIIYARAYTRAFCLGTLAALVATRLVANAASGLALSVFYPPPWMATNNTNSYGIEHGARWTLAFAGGLVAVIVRWLTMAKAANNPPRSGDGI